MTREIKFRAWALGLMWDVTTFTADWVEGLRGTTGIKFDEGDYTLVQYTGLKDKNGKEIYEGDIVLWFIAGKYDHKTLVSWADCGAWNYGFGKAEEMEVIGNKYENPELLNNK